MRIQVHKNSIVEIKSATIERDNDSGVDYILVENSSAVYRILPSVPRGYIKDTEQYNKIVKMTFDKLLRQGFLECDGLDIVLWEEK